MNKTFFWEHNVEFTNEFVGNINRISLIKTEIGKDFAKAFYLICFCFKQRWMFT